MKILHQLQSLALILLSTFTYSQNTIGTVLNTSGSFNGYTLFTPNTNASPNLTYLVDNCGQVVNSWESSFKGQGADVILEDGSLFRGAFDDQSTLNYAGNNGRLEHYDWDGNLIWGFTYSETDFSFHHDYYVLPNGNVLMVVAERKTMAEAIAAGRDPSTLNEGDLYTEKIIEFQPQGTDQATIVWEWDLWDHLIQDFDASKDNFGVVAENPQLLNLNFIGFSNNNADWTHVNAMDYNEDLDQIMFSARFTNEIYVIDHSTTTEEAASNSGGNSGKGGDFLYRWGNPQAYDRGTEDDQQFFGQHSTHWIPEGLPEAGKIMVFNNGFMRGHTTIEILTPPTPDSNGNYPITSSDPFEPANASIRYEDPNNQTDFFAPFLSSAYMLENGNVLINNGPVGQLFEVDPSNTKVWEYISPVTIPDGPISQGDSPGGVNSRFFRARRYAPDYAGFDGRDLTPGDPIELNPVLENCDLLSIEDQLSLDTIVIYPNPVQDFIQIATDTSIDQTSIYTINGQKVLESNTNTINVSSLSSGLYMLEIQKDSQTSIRKFIKQ